MISRLPSGPPSGRPLLFVHGAAHGAWCWDEHLLPWFADRGHPAHALDLVGHGDDPRPLKRSIGVAKYVADLAAAVATFDDPPVLVGHSMGGTIVQRYLEDKTLPGAVLLASVPVGGMWQSSGRVIRHHPGAFLRAIVTLRVGPIFGREREARALLFGPDMDRETMARYRERLGEETFRAYLDTLFRMPKPDRVLTPMLILAAGADHMISVRQQQRTASAYETTAVVVDSAAHDLMLDARWETSAEAILDWVHALPG